jgi:NAD(P)H-flavin reductase
MKIARASVEELFLDGSVRISCPPEVIPAPGQYLLAHADASSAPLAVPIFPAQSTPTGFRSAPPQPADWRPGARLILRGPLGHGFALPPFARHIALISFDDAPARLHGLIPLALKQGAEVVLVCDAPASDLPEVVEIQPLKAMREILQWADYVAMDAAREHLHQLRQMLGQENQAGVKSEAQILIRAPMPCGAVAECGACAIPLHHEWKMVCKDGPVFQWKDLQ